MLLGLPKKKDALFPLTLRCIDVHSWSCKAIHLLCDTFIACSQFDSLSDSSPIVQERTFSRPPLQPIILLAKIMAIRRLPTLFLSHGGGPAFFMDSKTSGPFAAMGKGSPACQFYASLGQMIPDEQIRAILVISAHWEEAEFTVTYHDGPQPPPLTYDYYGFPTDMYAPHMVYPARTDLKVADRVIELLTAASIPCRKDHKRGFDHGVFIPLKASFEDARFPVVQLSLKSGRYRHTQKYMA